MRLHSVGADSADAQEALRTLLRGAGRRFASVLTALQVSRMMRVLSSFSDGDLAKLGLARSDIPQHARWLVLGDVAGDRVDRR